MDKAPPTEQEIPGSSPGMGFFLFFFFSSYQKKKQKKNQKQKQKITSGEDRTHANKVDQNLSLAP